MRSAPPRRGQPPRWTGTCDPRVFLRAAIPCVMLRTLRRGGRAAEGAPLLREYGSKAHRGFESLPLRHATRPAPCGLRRPMDGRAHCARPPHRYRNPAGPLQVCRSFRHRTPVRCRGPARRRTAEPRRGTRRPADGAPARYLITHKAQLALPGRWKPGHRPRESGNPGAFIEVDSRFLPAFARMTGNDGLKETVCRALYVIRTDYDILSSHAPVAQLG